LHAGVRVLWHEHVLVEEWGFSQKCTQNVDVMEPYLSTFQPLFKKEVTNVGTLHPPIRDHALFFTYILKNVFNKATLNYASRPLHNLTHTGRAHLSLGVSEPSPLSQKYTRA